MIKIMYQDKAILVVVKPQGIACSQDKKASYHLMARLEDQLDLDELFLVHRLDRPTGGLMIFAKTKVAAAALSKTFSKRTLSKKYVCQVHGKFSEDSGAMEDYLKDGPQNTSLLSNHKEGKLAKLNYKVISYNSVTDSSRVEVELITGRKHQIRVQMASRGHQLLGDKKYGRADTYKELQLFSTSIKFNHPITNRTMSYTLKDSDLPF